MRSILCRCNKYNSTNTNPSGALFTAEYCNTRFSPIILVLIHLFYVSICAQTVTCCPYHILKLGPLTYCSIVLLVRTHLLFISYIKIQVGLILYLVAFQSGVGPVPWVYNPEVNPNFYEIRNNFLHNVNMSFGVNFIT